MLRAFQRLAPGVVMYGPGQAPTSQALDAAEASAAWLKLASGDMAALFELPVEPLAEWLQNTYELVPAGHELSGIDWDIATADLLRIPRRNFRLITRNARHHPVRQVGSRPRGNGTFTA
ncbi:SsgA family sporulation/cell division regulator [Embleya sp. NPDC005575]|uniref:SsgA family sporulation/cell division regulator n=1 Tax=Embleya sp. NPDC005575 TaxID=3156892 RepID=UPI0033A8A008